MNTYTLFRFLDGDDRKLHVHDVETDLCIGTFLMNADDEETFRRASLAVMETIVVSHERMI